LLAPAMFFPPGLLSLLMLLTLMIFDKAAPVRIIVEPLLFKTINYNYINFLM